MFDKVLNTPLQVITIIHKDLKLQSFFVTAYNRKYFAQTIQKILFVRDS